MIISRQYPKMTIKVCVDAMYKGYHKEREREREREREGERESR
jgi:hypothetical protein